MSSPAQPIQQNAPVAPNVPAPAAPPIDNLVQPGGNFQPSPLDATNGPGGPSINSEVSAAQAANAKYASDAAAPLKVAPVPGVAQPGTPHYRLMNMIAGLSLGLGSFGTAIATHGREGGAPEVQDFYAKQNEERLQNQQAAQQTKDVALQQDLTMANVHMENAKVLQSLFSVPDEINSSHLKVEQSEQDLRQGDARLTNLQLQNQKLKQTIGEDGPIGQAAADSTNSQLLAIYQTTNPKATSIPSSIQLGPNSTPKDVADSMDFIQKLQKGQQTGSVITKNTAQANAAQKLPNGSPSDSAPTNYTPPATPFKMTQAGLGQYLTSQHQTVPPDFATLYAVGHYQADPNTFTKYLRNGSGQRDKDSAINYIRTYINPNFDEKNYDAVKNMQKSFASPKLSDAGGTLIAFQTANGHLQQFQQAATALNNGDVQTLNKIANTFGVEVGKSPVITFNAIRAALGGEIGKIFKGGAADVPGTQDIISILNSNQSPQQMADVAKTYQHLMNSKAATLVQQYYVYTGYLPPQASWIDPSLLPPGAAVQAGGTAGAQPTAQPAVGTVKTFPNGNKGIWDGRGWVKQ